MFVGNNLSSLTTLTNGSGVAGNGSNIGVYGYSPNTGNDRWGGLFETAQSGTRTYVGGRAGGTNYKILGQLGSSVSTTMPTRDGERILYAPEAPENWFFDIGEVKLVNGKARVELDPLFYDCISHEKPFKVFVQGAENTLGAIRVKARGDNWFELEDTGGASSGTVMFNIYAIWKGKENIRLPKFEDPIKIEKVERVALTADHKEPKINSQPKKS